MSSNFSASLARPQPTASSLSSNVYLLSCLLVVMFTCSLVVSSRHTDALFLSLRVRSELVIRERRLSNFIVSVRWHSATSERHDRSIGRQPPGRQVFRRKKTSSSDKVLLISPIRYSDWFGF